MTWIISSPYLKNVFAEKLGRFGFDLYQILIVDLMHRFKLDVWNAVFMHLIHILYAAGPFRNLVSELDKRYVLPTEIEHIQLTSADFIRLQLSMWIQFRNLLTTHLKWKKWWLEISRTSYRYPSYILKILSIPT